MNLSICIITKNEEKNIQRCLTCLAPYNFEIIVVDTGSTDHTVEIASQYTSNIYHFTWCNDFAAAKNLAISKATNEYVMVIDSDEYLESINIEKLYFLIEQHPDMVGRIHRKNTFVRNKLEQEHSEWINRIFSKEKFYYQGKIHEQITSINNTAYETYCAPVIISHSGYDLPEKERKEKAQRNIHLLKQELKRLELEASEISENENLENKLPLDKNGQIPYILFQLGKGYYMAGDYLQACNYFSKGLCYDLNPKLEYVINMVETYGYALINSGQAETALSFENIYEEFGNTADFQFLMGLIYMNNAYFPEAIQEFEKATKHSYCKCKGVNSYLAYYNIGVIYECLGYTEQAQEYYRKCGNYEPEIQRLQHAIP